MRYSIWNNKGGVGKTFLTFILGAEYAYRFPEKRVLWVDMCPQANLSEIVLGGNSNGNTKLEKFLAAGKDRKTIGGYFDERIVSAHSMTGNETSFVLTANDYNKALPENLSIICGDSSLEIQVQAINQLSSLVLPPEAWRNVHCWLRDLVAACAKKLGGEDNVLVMIDCNPSFSAYTELALLASDKIIAPCSSDGSSARAIDNLSSLVYGRDNGQMQYGDVGFAASAKKYGLALPLVHSVILNRSTQYYNRASKAFGAMFDEIKDRTRKFRANMPQHFVAHSSAEALFEEMPDSHTVAIVASHLGLPLEKISAKKYQIHDNETQVNAEPLQRYKDAVDRLVNML